MSATSSQKQWRFALAAIPLALAALSLHAQSTQYQPRETTWCADRCDQVVIDWNAHAHQVIKAADGYQNPLGASRSLAMMHLAMHDAVNAVQPRYRAYAFEAAHAAGKNAGEAAIAAVVAAHDVLAALYPQQKDLLRATRDQSLHDAGLGAAIENAKHIGAAAAKALLAKRAADGSNANEAYQPGTRPGEYQFVPGTDFLGAPHWRNVTPFSMVTTSQFRVAPFPALTSARYRADFNEVKAVGSNAGDAKRSVDQTQYAAYWYEFSDSGWNRIARVVARDNAQNLWDRARTFALLNAVMADAYIAGWDAKLHYNLWRPVTAIRQAATDGNDATVAAATWTPLLPTPPIQDYPSTHSALGSAAATVLAHAFGDRTRFTMASPSASPDAPARTFASFSIAARENADSRVRAGLHFRFATTEGMHLGERIGAQAVKMMLAPAH